MTIKEPHHIFKIIQILREVEKHHPLAIIVKASNEQAKKSHQTKLWHKIAKSFNYQANPSLLLIAVKHLKNKR